MGKPRQTLKTLRAIALDHASVTEPDLATMVRELGQVAHRNSAAIAAQLRRQRRRGFGQWVLARRGQPPVSVMLMAWPANHRTMLHDHAGLWGLELALVGALEVQSWRRDPDSGDLRALGSDWLGPGDGTWFERDRNHLHRCRNLSQHETALTLQVYGGEPRGCESFNLEARPRMAGRESVTQVTDSREHVRACTGRAMEENHRKWFPSQALSRRSTFAQAAPTAPWTQRVRQGVLVGHLPF
jgi:hypothetical protein